MKDESKTPEIKYPWHEAPEWAKYAATDENGERYWFESHPERERRKWDSIGGRVELIGDGIGWKESLQERPPAPKSVLDWLSQAKDEGYEWADGAIECYSEEESSELVKVYGEPNSYSSALQCAFRWCNAKTKKSAFQWFEVHNSLLNQGK